MNTNRINKYQSSAIINKCSVLHLGRVEILYKSKYENNDVQPIHIVKSNVLSVGPFFYFLFLSDEGPMLKMLDFTIRIGRDVPDTGTGLKFGSDHDHGCPTIHPSCNHCTGMFLTNTVSFS